MINPFSKKKPAVRVSACVSDDFWNLANENHIGWSEALRVGISILLAERGVTDYDNNLNIVRNLKRTVERLNETATKLADQELKLEAKNDK